MSVRLMLLLFAYLSGGNMHPASTDFVTITVIESIIYVGKSTAIPIWVEIKEGYHIQANRLNDESLIPTTIELNMNNNFTISKQEFPPGKKFKLEGSSTLLKVYDGKFRIRLFVSPVAGAQTGKYIMGAKLRYQACDSKTCLFPRDINFSIPVEVKTAEVVAALHKADDIMKMN